MESWSTKTKSAKHTAETIKAKIKSLFISSDVDKLGG